MEKNAVKKSRTSSKKNSIKNVNKSKKNNKNIKKYINKNSNKKSKKIIKILAIIIVFFCIAVALLKIPYFNVTSIIVVGNTKYTSEEIIEKLDIKTGKNIFLEIFSGYKNNLSKLPYIDTVKLSIKSPKSLSLKITERSIAYLAYDKEKNNFFRIDKNGYILEQIDINSKADNEILVYGLSFDNDVKFGQKINDTYISKFIVYEKISKEFESSGINGKITKVNFENSLTTITINDKLNVILPNDDNLKYNMSFLYGIIQKLGEDSIGKIDMTRTNPTFSSF